MWGLTIFVFIISLIIFSNQFVEYILYSFGGESLVVGNQTTSKGTIVQCIILTLSVLLFEVIKKAKKDKEE